VGYESFDDAVANAYREVVAEGGDEPTKKQEAFDIAAERIVQLVLDGVIEVPHDKAIRAALDAVDQMDGKSVDRTLTLLSAGHDALDYEDDPMLDRVAVLGTGLRKSFRHITIEDFRVMDSLRYQNLRSAQEAYHRWRVQFEGWQPYIERHRTIGEAVAAGDVPDFDQ
jgi:hypothetical protein